MPRFPALILRQRCNNYARFPYNIIEGHLGRHLRWTQRGVAYELSTGHEFMCPGQADNQCPLTDDELIRIAESVE